MLVWEEELSQQFMEVIAPMIITQRPDSWWCAVNSQGIFTVKSLSHFFMNV
jgi:hypothetical protein